MSTHVPQQVELHPNLEQSEGNYRTLITVRPSMACNFHDRCEYCYQAPMRGVLAGIPLDVDDMCATIDGLWEAANNPHVTVSGGEPFTTPKKKLSQLFIHIARLQGFFGVITNGTLVTEDWIPLFKMFNGSITFSFDGPAGLNRGRSTDIDDAHIMKMIDAFTTAGVNVQVSVVLNDHNITHADELFKWMEELYTKGVKLGYLQGLRDPSIDPWATGPIWERLVDLVFDTDWCRYEPAVGVIDMFRGRINRWCFRNPCDPYSTYNILDVFADGSFSSCIFTQMNNKSMMPLQVRSFERCHALFWTPQEEGGCQGCKWWTACYGGCPGNAHDPRKRDTSCEAYKMLFEKVWQRMVEKGMNPKIPDHVEYFDPHVPMAVERVIPHATGRIQKTVVNNIEMEEFGNGITLRYDSSSCSKFSTNE